MCNNIVVLTILWVLKSVKLPTYFYSLQKLYNIPVSECRRFEKLTEKRHKLRLDLEYFEKCLFLNVIPKFLQFKIPNLDAIKSNVENYHKLTLESHIKYVKREIKINDRKYKVRNDSLRSKLSWLRMCILDMMILAEVKSKMKTHTMRHNSKISKLWLEQRLPAPDCIVNKSKYVLSPIENETLRFGLKNSIIPKKTDNFGIKYQIEKTITANCKDNEELSVTQALKQDIIATVNNFENNAKSEYRSNTNKRLHRTLTNLAKMKNLKICSFDKGNGIVLVDADEYFNKLDVIINDTSKFKKVQVPDDLKKHPTIMEEGRLYRYLVKYVKRYITEDTYKYIMPSGSEPAKMYGTIKVHKTNAPARPIVSTRGSYNYNLAKYLDTIIKQHINKTYLLSSTAEFIDRIKEKQSVFNKNNVLVSFDVESLFTNVPVDEVINIAANLVYSSNSNNKPRYGKDVFIKLCKFATQGSFMYNDNMYTQTDGVSMGSPLAPTLANLFLAELEQGWMGEQFSPLFYSRYVDDCICVFDNVDKIHKFHEYLNRQHPNLKFTTEVGNNKLPFLDVFINTEDTLQTSIYRKDTYTGLLLNYNSVCPRQWKVGLINGMLHRAYTVSNCWEMFHNEVKNMTSIFQKNGYPRSTVEKIVRNFLNKKNTVISNGHNDTCTSTADAHVNYTVLPYIGQPSLTLRNNLMKIYKRYGINSKIVFNTTKVKSYFSLKCKSGPLLKSCVVYEFTCLGDPSSQYIGKTKRRLQQRIEEHRSTDTAVYKHINTCNHCTYDISNQFRIRYKGNSNYHINVVEALMIKEYQPKINHTADYNGMSYLLKVFK